MVEILKHGTGNYYKLYECVQCGCVFRSTEYKHNVEYGYVARCPECNKPNIDLVGTKKVEALTRLVDNIKNSY